MELSQRNNLRRERALWAVKLAIPSPVRERGLSESVDGEPEIDLRYQEDYVASDQDSLTVDVSDLPLKSINRVSIYDEAENYLQKVLSEHQDSQPSSPLSTPKSLTSNSFDEQARDGSGEIGLNEEISPSPYCPPDHEVALRMHRYLSESEGFPQIFSPDP